jgi:4-hydroxy-3-polyprenylbenzoate decarboxylase
LRLIVAITGASGVVYGKRLLEVLREKRIETHLIISEAAEKVIKHELDATKRELEKLASHVYDADDLTAPVVSGSFKTDGMVIIPCSMKTLAGIAHGYSDNLILRAADVTLKEKRKLILVPRETPLSVVHLRNMLDLASQGVAIMPAMPAYYHKPKKMEDLIDFIVGKVLDLLKINHELFERWHEKAYKNQGLDFVNV